MSDLVERAKALALVGDFSPDDLGGDIGTMSLRNPDGPELLSIIESLQSDNERMREALEKIVEHTAKNGDWFELAQIEQIVRAALTTVSEV